jgi:hypothetical protein
VDSSAVTAAAARFERAWAIALKDKAEHVSPSEADMVEVHDAALELVRATSTHTLQEALRVLEDIDL